MAHEAVALAQHGKARRASRTRGCARKKDLTSGISFKRA